jgi:hypothetical protein
MSVLASDLIEAGYRICGISLRPGRKSNADKLAEGLQVVNRLVGNWNADPLKIFTNSIAAFPLVAGQKIYTMGTGGNFNVAPPQRITFANIIVTPASGAAYRRQLQLLTDQRWSEVAVQDIGGTIPKKLYCDYGYPLSSLYLWGQPLANYQLELYTWQLIASFAAITDAVILPPGYEEAIIYNLAKRLAAQNPHDATITQQALDLAVSSLADIESKNAPAPVLKVDGAINSVGGKRGGGWSYLTNQ